MAFNHIPHNKQPDIPPELAGMVRDTRDFRKKYVPPEEAKQDRQDDNPPDQKQLDAQFIIDQASKPSEPEPKRDQETRDLYDAIQMAEMFEENRVKESYIIKEGWDLYLLINAIVVLYREHKRMRMALQGQTEASTESCPDECVSQPEEPKVPAPEPPCVKPTIQIDERPRLERRSDQGKRSFLL